MTDHEALAAACEKVGIDPYKYHEGVVTRYRPDAELRAAFEGWLREHGWWFTLSGFPDEGDGDDMPGGFDMTWTLNEEDFCVCGGWCKDEETARRKAAIAAAGKCKAREDELDMSGLQAWPP